MIQHITLEEVKAAARLAYKEGRLLAQAGTQSVCYYKKGEFVCAIGAVLSEESLAEVERKGFMDAGIHKLLDHRIISCPSGSGAELNNLQNLHDNWALRGEVYAKEQFLKRIDWKEEEDEL